MPGVMVSGPTPLFGGPGLRRFGEVEPLEFHAAHRPRSRASRHARSTRFKHLARAHRVGLPSALTNSPRKKGTSPSQGTRRSVLEVQARQRVGEAVLPAGDLRVVVALVVRVPAEHHVAEAEAAFHCAGELVDVRAAQDADIELVTPSLRSVQMSCLPRRMPSMSAWTSVAAGRPFSGPPCFPTPWWPTPCKPSAPGRPRMSPANPGPFHPRCHRAVCWGRCYLRAQAPFSPRRWHVDEATAKSSARERGPENAGSAAQHAAQHPPIAATACVPISFGHGLHRLPHLVRADGADAADAEGFHLASACPGRG